MTLSGTSREGLPQCNSQVAAGTRFASNVIMLDRYITCRDVLLTVVNGDGFKEYVKTLPVTANAKNSAFIVQFGVTAVFKYLLWIRISIYFTRADLCRPQEMTEDIRDICGDRCLKACMEKLINLLVPVIKVLRLCDSGADACAVAFIYPAMYELKTFMDRPEEDRSIRPFRQHLSELVSARWEFLFNPMHAAAYALNPRYHNIIADIMRNPEVGTGLKDVLEKLSTSPEEKAGILSDLVDCNGYIYQHDARKDI